MQVKGNNCYNCQLTIDGKPGCLRDPENQQSEHAVSVHSKKTNQRVEVLQVIGKIDEKYRDASEETQVPAGGIVIPCMHLLYGTKIHKASMLAKIK